MRLIKLGLISLVALFIVATAVTAMFPSTVIVSRAVNIHAVPDSIRPYISDIHAWRKWIAGMNDTSVKISSPTQATMGRTIVTLTNITDTAVYATWITKDGSNQLATINLISNPGQQVTVVHWQFVQHVKWYPWQKLGSFMNDKILGPMMETNLENLRILVEGGNK